MITSRKRPLRVVYVDTGIRCLCPLDLAESTFPTQIKKHRALEEAANASRRPQTRYRPRNAGLRFSMKAVRPST